jgi:hypothetical protein
MRDQVRPISILILLARSKHPSQIWHRSNTSQIRHDTSQTLPTQIWSKLGANSSKREFIRGKWEQIPRTGKYTTACAPRLLSFCSSPRRYFQRNKYDTSYKSNTTQVKGGWWGNNSEVWQIDITIIEYTAWQAPTLVGSLTKSIMPRRIFGPVRTYRE